MNLGKQDLLIYNLPQSIEPSSINILSEDFTVLSKEYIYNRKYFFGRRDFGHLDSGSSLRPQIWSSEYDIFGFSGAVCGDASSVYIDF